MIRRLEFDPLPSYHVHGDLREMKTPDGQPTPRQWKYLNNLGCVLLVEPRGAEPLTRADVAGAISAALRIAGDES